MAEEQLELDCYHKAEEGEPKFTLLARDKVAPSLIKMWAAFRSYDLVEASYHFHLLCGLSETNYIKKAASPSKIESAIEIANEMTNWQRR